MPLSNDPVVIIADSLKAYTFSSSGVVIKTSPPGQGNYASPMVFVRGIEERQRITNVHATNRRTTAEVWVYASANSKATVTAIKNDVITWHRSVWLTIGSGISYIIYNGMVHNDHLEWKPQIFERIFKLEIVWDE